MSFKQEKWLEPYVDLNTMKRKAAQNKFEEDFFKLMTNSAYGKCCEGKRNRINVNIVRSETELDQSCSKPHVSSIKIINDEMATVALRETKILWNKPTIVGAVILDLAKTFMFEFHYLKMKKTFDCSLLYSDTDSLVYEIRSNDFYQDLRNSTIFDEFDTSNFDPLSPLYDKKYKKEVLKFKDEMGGESIHEFCGLKAKQYSILCQSK